MRVRSPPSAPFTLIPLELNVRRSESRPLGSILNDGRLSHPMRRTAEERLPDWLRPILVCPECRGDLHWQANVIRCVECPASFQQDDGRVIDLQSSSAVSDFGPDWLRRQQEMTRGYDELLADREHLILAYNSDYGPLTDLLQRYRGRVVDLGGGSGLLATGCRRMPSMWRLRRASSG